MERPMSLHVIGFRPPIIGLEGEFNTIRVGGFWAKRLNPGMRVFLMDEAEKLIVALAEVTSIETGPLADLCERTAHGGHTHKHITDGTAGKKRLALVKKLYGPMIATDNKPSVVIWLRMIEWQSSTEATPVTWASGKAGTRRGPTS